MNTQTFLRTLGAGIAGTSVMTAVTFMAPLMGLPEMNTAKMLSGFMGVSVTAGWFAHFMIGIVLAFIYTTIFANRIPGSGWIRGAIYGIVPWLVLQSMLSPMMGSGIFSLNTPTPVLIVLGSFMGHVIYGAVVGTVWGNRPLAVDRIIAAR